MNKKLVINLCPTGMIPRTEKCPHVPISPKEIALEIKRCYELGVSMAHIHARDANQEPSWNPEIYSEILNEIRHYTPDVIIVVSTSGRNWNELDKRSASLLVNPGPDMGSLTLGSLNFPNQVSANSPQTIKGLLSIMNDNQIVPELEIFNTGMINYAQHLIDKSLLKPPFYFNLIFGSLGSASLNATNIGAMISSLPQNATWSLGGIGRFQLSANTIAVALGGHVRVGLEDNPYYNWSTKNDASNPRLVERIVRIAKEFGREMASPQEARKLIGI